MTKTCCITGHRQLSPEQFDQAKFKLQEAIDQAILEGYTHFITGLADGIDLLFAELIIEKRKTAPIRLEAAVPYRRRIQNANAALKRVINQCDACTVLSENYHPGCFHDRNKWMVDHSDLVIAVHDGRISGGTVFTMEYAKAQGKNTLSLMV